MTTTSKRTNPVKLFQSVPNTDYSRLIVRYPFQDDAVFAFSYKESADRLASTFKGDAPDDLMLLPFLTLYRQAYELQLKVIIHFLAGIRRTYGGEYGKETDATAIDLRLKKDIGHNLHKLLNELLKHYDALDLGEPFPESTKKLILLLHDADGSGTAFRYSGELPDTTEHIDFPNLVKLLNDEWNLLNGVWSWIEAGYDAMPTLDDLM